jgi:hypothetical protein
MLAFKEDQGMEMMRMSSLKIWHTHLCSWVMSTRSKTALSIHRTVSFKLQSSNRPFVLLALPLLKSLTVAPSPKGSVVNENVANIRKP